jgi:pimeloyl-[acyl-carrier protein] methyl ester esterase
LLTELIVADKARHPDEHDQPIAHNGQAAPMLKLVLLPGMDGTGKLFSAFIAVLPPSCETVIVRYPTDEPLSYRELEEIVRAACPVSGRFILVAESFSTPLAIQYAATHPANLAGVVLCVGFAASPVRGWRRLFGSLLAPLLLRVPLPNSAAKLWLVGPNAPASLLAAVRSAIASVQPRVLAARLRAVLKCDMRAYLNQIDIPILYIQANGDRFIDGSCMEEVRRIKPQLKVVSIDGPHLLLQRQPRIAAEAVVQFAGSCCPSTPP